MRAGETSISTHIRQWIDKRQQVEQRTFFACRSPEPDKPELACLVEREEGDGRRPVDGRTWSGRRRTAAGERAKRRELNMTGCCKRVSQESCEMARC